MHRVLLIGMMGSGKSTVGHAISARTGWPYIDNDELVAQITGVPTRALLARDGERVLREVESRVLTSLLEWPASMVAGIPGGVVHDPSDRARLEHTDAHVVWLRAQVATLAERVRVDAGRPWLDESVSDALTALAAAREPLYAEVADQVVDVDTLPPDRIARLILDAIGLP